MHWMPYDVFEQYTCLSSVWLFLQNYVYVRNISRHEYNELKPILVGH
jgi:hypothetical protein